MDVERFATLRVAQPVRPSSTTVRSLESLRSLDALKTRFTPPASATGSIPPSPPESDFGGGVGVSTIPRPPVNSSVQSMQRAVAAAPKRRTPSAQPAAPFDAAAAPFDADTLPANKKEKYLSILHASLPAIENSTIPELASGLLLEPRTLRKCYQGFFATDGFASQTTLLAFLRRVLRADPTNQMQVDVIKRMVAQIMAETPQQIDYTGFEAGLLKLSSKAGASQETPVATMLDPAITSLYERVSALRSASARQAAKRTFNKAGDLDELPYGAPAPAEASSALLATGQADDDDGEKEQKLTLSTEAREAALRMRKEALDEREELRKDISRVMGSHWEHGGSRFAIQYEGQSKTEEISNAIDEVKPGMRVAVYQLKRRADPETQAPTRRYRSSGETQPTNGAEAIVQSGAPTRGLASDIGMLPDPFDAEFAEKHMSTPAWMSEGAAGQLALIEMQGAAADGGAAGTQDTGAAGGARGGGSIGVVVARAAAPKKLSAEERMTLDQVHKAANEGDRDALLLATARKDWRSKQSVDLAEELAIADSMHAEDGKGKGGGASSTKQATIKTHRVAYYSSTRIMGMEVEFDGGDAFPKKRD